MVHLVCLPCLVRDYVNENVDGGVGVVRRGSIAKRNPARFMRMHKFEIEKDAYSTGTRSDTAFAPVTLRTATSPSRLVRPYKLIGFVGDEGVYGG